MAILEDGYRYSQEWFSDEGAGLGGSAEYDLDDYEVQDNGEKLIGPSNVTGGNNMIYVLPKQIYKTE